MIRFVFGALISVLLSGNAVFAHSGLRPGVVNSMETYSAELEELGCQKLDIEKLGLTPLASFPVPATEEFDFGLQAYVFRDMPPEAAQVQGMLAVDWIFVFPFENERNAQVIDMYFAMLDRNREDFAMTLTCPFKSPPNVFQTWHEFVNPVLPPVFDGRLLLRVEPVIFRIAHFRQLTSETEMLPATDTALRDVEAMDESNDGEPVESKEVANSPYPWTAQIDIRSAVEGEQVMTVESVECEQDKLFAIVSAATVLSSPSTEQEDNELLVVREKLTAANVNVGASGSNDTRQIVEASIDPEHYWCIPRQEFCYKQVEFGSFDLPLTEGSEATLPVDRVYNLRLGIVTALQRLYVDSCTGNSVAE